MKRQLVKRVMCVLLAGAMLLPLTALNVSAEAEYLVEDVDIASSAWASPEIPLGADMVVGVAKPVISLNETTKDGTWKFLLEGVTTTGIAGIPVPRAANQSFDPSVLEGRNWKDVIVPGGLVMQGFDIINNREYYYQRQIFIPADYASNRVLLRFDAVYSNARVWIDGNYIRTHIGGFTTWDADITDYVTPGESVTLTVGIADIERESSSNNAIGVWNPNNQNLADPSGASDYAHHNMGGINRDVYLLAFPKDYIARVYANTVFTDLTYTDADLEVTAQLGMFSDEAKLKVELFGKDGSLVVSGDIDFQNPVYDDPDIQALQALIDEANELIKDNEFNLYDDTIGAEGGNGQYAKSAYDALVQERDIAVEMLKAAANSSSLSQARKITIPVGAPLKWDAEHPNLYTLKTTLSVGGTAIQSNSQKIGFREITYNGAKGTDRNRVYVNGKEVKLRGTCRHDVSYDLGRSTTAEQDWAEIKAYKEANINYIRTSHYPASKHILEACDEYGMYVEQESAVAFRGTWGGNGGGYAPPEDYIVQFTDMIERDRNHASVLIWSLGNESYFDQTTGLRVTYNYARDVDPTRPLMFSYPDGGYVTSTPRPWDIYSSHYPGYNSGNLGNSNYPVLHDEYGHIKCYDYGFELRTDMSVRNFWGDSIKRFWDNMFNTNGCLGGALWGGIDDVFFLPAGTSERHQRHGSGPAAGYGEWGSVLDAFMRLKPEAFLTKKAYSPIRINGREETDVFAVTGGNTLTIPVRNRFDHTNFSELEIKYTVGGTTVTVNGPNIAPHATGNLVFTDAALGGAEVINIKFFTPFDGLMVEEFNLKLQAYTYPLEPISGPPPVITTGTGTITVTGSDFEVVFNTATAQITSAKFGGKTLITGGPRLHAISGSSDAVSAWTAATPAPSATISGDEAVVTLSGTQGTNRNITFTVRISGNGIMTTSYALSGSGWTINNLRELGVNFNLAGGVGGVSWLRNGLYTAYPEDHIGRNEGFAIRSRLGPPDQYGVLPQWAWKDDMKNYFLFPNNSSADGIVTNDFKTMREYIWRYDVNFAGTEATVRVESTSPTSATQAARVDPVSNRLIINQRWYYPDLGWGNYMGSAGSVNSSTTGSVRLRFLDTKSPVSNIATLVGVTITNEGGKQLKATPNTVNDGSDCEYTYQWYRLKVGDPERKTAAIAGANGSTYNASGEFANTIYCTATLTQGGQQMNTATSNKLTLDENLITYHDIETGQPGMAFIGGVQGTDYWTDRNQPWTATAHNRSVTYLVNTRTKLEFTFTGSEIRWCGGKENNQGIARVIIDEGTANEYSTEVDLFDAAVSSGQQVSEILFSYEWPTVGTHTISIQSTGRTSSPVSTNINVSLDVFILINNGITGAAPSLSAPVVNYAPPAGFAGVVAASALLPNAFVPKYSQEDILAEAVALAQAIEDFLATLVTADISILAVTIADAEEIVAAGNSGGLYSPAAWQTLENALAAAKDLLKTAYKQSEVNAADNALFSAMLDTILKIPVTGVSLNKGTTSIAAGQTETLVAEIAPADAMNKRVTWSSDNEAAATVQNGVVTAVAVGAATITVTTADGGFTASCVVQVTPKRVAGMSLDRSAISISLLESETLIATVTPLDAANKKVLWSSSDDAIAAVDEDGVVTGLSLGTATITATTDDGGFTDTCIVTVRAPVGGISMNKKATNLIMGSTETLVATVLPANALNKNVTWSSSAQSIATVSSDGVVSAISAGIAIITATTEEGGFTASCTVRVTPTTVLTDSSSAGNWIGKYGSNGYIIYGSASDGSADKKSLPAYMDSVELADSGTDKGRWNADTSVVGARLQNPDDNGATRISGVAYANGYLTLTLNPNDSELHSITLYTVDINPASGQTRRQTITAVNADGVPIIQPIVMNTDFRAGRYMTFNFRGQTTITLTNNNTQANAIISGLFFDGEIPPDSTPLVFTDSGSSGDWIGKYGLDGYVIYGAIAAESVISWPGYMTPFSPVLTGTSGYYGSGMSIGARLQDPRDNGLSRIHGMVYAGTSVRFTLTPLDNEPHLVTLYCVDTDGNRVQSITAVDAGGNSIIPATSINGFASGRYVTFNYKGTTTITVARTTGNNTVLNGIFFDSPVIPVTGFGLAEADVSMEVGETETLTPVFAPVDASNKTVVWSSSNESVATVSDGVITAVSAGTATITGKTADGGYVKSCAVTVNLNLSINSNYKIYMTSVPQESSAEFDPVFKIKNLSAGDKTVIVIVAAYVNGKLAGINLIEDTISTEKDIPISLAKIPNAEYKFFVWDEWYVPLTERVTVGDGTFLSSFIS